MSRAEEAKLDSVTENQIIQTAWKDHAGNTPPDDRYVAMLFGIRAGYAKGRADAWQLPEVRAEELEEGKWYLAVDADGEEWIGKIEKYDSGNVGFSAAKTDNPSDGDCFLINRLPDGCRFRGPLPLGDQNGGE